MTGIGGSTSATTEQDGAEADGRSRALVEMRGLGICDFIEKPFEIKMLMDALDRHS